MSLRTTLILIIALSTISIAADLCRPTDRQTLSRIAISQIHFYQKYISPKFSQKLGIHCKFTPTCSEYAVEAITRYGMIKGGWLAAKRIARCNRWNDDFGFDPVP